MKNSSLRALAAWSCGLLLTAACGAGPAPAAKETLVPVPPPPGPARSLPPATLIGVADTPKGTIVVDAEGRALYVYAEDPRSTARKRATPKCTGACAATWPPALAPGGMPVALPGITPASLGVVVREDGGKQITLDGHPLYRYSGDTAPRQTNGDGTDPAWRLATPPTR
ncbi:hypothetical protein ABGB17_11225 [Sphaerisporangium sp. B11E5]|uniref:COG4315 family predicted lipoprotein n=1 Tax=Sphaerisporangium sp. B11E5 TaxID=3153563 RepID=UPI00325D31A7